MVSSKYKIKLFVFEFIFNVDCIFIELLNKDKNERLTIKDALDHAWFVGANEAISTLRKSASQDGNEMMKFISYSNHDPKAAHEASKKSSNGGSPV